MLLIQVIVGLLVGAAYYMVAMVMTVYDGVLSLILQPIMAAIFAAGAVCLCLVLGLPIRLLFWLCSRPHLRILRSSPLNPWLVVVIDK